MACSHLLGGPATLEIVSALNMSTAERKREPYVIRAIGGLRGQSRKMILLPGVDHSYRIADRAGDRAAGRLVACAENHELKGGRGNRM